MHQTSLLKFTAVIIAALMVSGCCPAKKAKMVQGDIPLTTIPSGTFVEPPEEYRSIFQPVYFDYDKSDIRNDMVPRLKQVAEWLQTHPAVLVRSEGHCDERGSDQYNMALGERRALSVRRFLVDQGVDADRLYTVSYGEEQPVNPGHNEAAWAENRRVEFKLSQ